MNSYLFRAATLLAVAMAFAAHSQEDAGQISRCHSFPNGDARLACYDSQTNYEALEAESASNSAGTGHWIRREDKSQLTDDRNLYFFLDSENEVYHEYSHQRVTGKATIIARCVENATAFIVRMDDKFLADSGGYGRIEYRLDEKKMQSRNFSESTSNKALGLWRGAGIPMLKELNGAKKLVMRITPYNENAQEMIFDVEGANVVVQELRELCHW